MSSPGVDRRFFDKPPAATTGSPGTAIFSPPSLQSTRPFARSNNPSTSTARLVQPPPSAAPTKSDPVPVQWSFESSYSLFGSAPSHDLPPREPRTSGVLGGTWLGMRKDKNVSQPTLDRSKFVGASATRVPCPAPPPDGPASIRASPPQTLEASVIPSPAGNARPATHPIHTSLSSSAPRGITHFPDSFSGSQSERIPLHRTVSNSPPDSTRAPLLTIPASTRTPLLTIPASNAPTYASTPTFHSSHPLPNFRHPLSHRPGNFSGVSSTALTGSALMHTHRRLATSSAVPQFRDTALSPGGLDTADASKPSLIPSAALTIESMSSNTATETVPETKKIMTELARRKTEEARKRGFRMKNGKRHHPMSKEEAPYPRDYERKTTDHDVWEHCCAVNLIKGNTFHKFDKPPTKVLDVGCGTGQWIIQCAREWKDTYFVGFDLVPIQPNVTRLGDPRFASRIDWVLGNFLEPFPFEDGEFDFVHVRRVARGVPEDRWDAFFEEVTRVLKVGGAFEMTEEDLFFPGSLDVEDDEDENEEDEDVDERESADSEGGEAQKENKVTREVREVLPPPTLPHSKFPFSVGDVALHGSLASKSPFGQTHRKGNKTTLPVVQLPTERLAHSRDSFLSMRDEDDEDDMSETIDHSAARSMERSGTMRIEGSHPDASTGAGIPPPRSTNPTSERAHTATKVLGPSAQQSTFERVARSQGHGSQVLTLSGRPNHPQHSPAEDHNLPRVSLNSWYALEHTVADILSHTVGEENEEYLNVGAGSSLYHANTAPVSNPRDHSLLETAYNELHAARFINLAPLAMLNSILVLHFKDVRSHPPTQISLPSMPISTAKPGRKQANIESSKLHRSESYSTPHRTRPLSAPSSRPRLDSSSSTSPNPPDSTDGIDDTNATDTDRFAPIVTEPVPNITMFRLLGKTAPQEQEDFSESRLSYGNRGMMHTLLTARMSEVLACAEEMWEFIEECRESSARWRNPSIAALAEVSREEWEDCLSRYTMDMQDRIGMGTVVRERLGWGMREMQRSAERKAFDEAVKKWDSLCRLREEQTPREKKKRNTRQHRLSRTFKVFVAWK